MKKIVLDASTPGGTTRVSDAVIKKLTIMEAHGVEGVADVRGLLVGAVVGGVTGGLVGMMHGGPAGAALGAPVGTAAGAAAGDAIDQFQRRRKFYDTGGELGPPVTVRVTCHYGSNLTHVAREIRERVSGALLALTGLTPADVEVEFVDVVGGGGGSGRGY